MGISGLRRMGESGGGAILDQPKSLLTLRGKEFSDILQSKTIKNNIAWEMEERNNPTTRRFMLKS